MSKKDNKNASSTPEFSINSEPEKDGQDNGFFFKNEDAVKTEETAAENTASAENNAVAVKQSTETDGKNDAVGVTEAVASDASDEVTGESELTDNSNDSESANGKKEGGAVENGKADGDEKSSGFGYYLRIAGILTIICSFVALMLASVNMITKDTIAENEKKEKTAAVTQIFTEADDAFFYEDYTGDEEIYIATKEGKLYGYCVSVVSQGYGGEISMMVGIRYDGNVEGVKIVSMSETAGLGSKTKNDSFLSQFSHQKGPFTVGENVDAVAGATISSKAVTSGVNSAVNLAITPDSIASRNGLSVYGEEPVSSETEESTSDSENGDTDTTAADVGNGLYDIPGIGTTAAEDTHIDPSSVGQYQTKYYYEQDKSYTWSRENGHYLEKETTDTESDTSAETEAAI